MFDPFGEDLPVYFFENTCRENSDLKLNDKSYKVCYNVNAFEKAGDGKRNIFIDDWYDRGYDKGIAIGEERDIAQGEHKKAIETARGMLSYGMPKDKIAEISGLPLEEIQQLAEES